MHQSTIFFHYNIVTAIVVAFAQRGRQINIYMSSNRFFKRGYFIIEHIRLSDYKMATTDTYQTPLNTRYSSKEMQFNFR